MNRFCKRHLCEQAYICISHPCNMWNSISKQKIYIYMKKYWHIIIKKTPFLFKSWEASKLLRMACHIYTICKIFFFFKYWKLINRIKIFQCIKFLTERVNWVLQALKNVLTPVVKRTKDKNTSCHSKMYFFFLFINKRCISNLLISRYASFSLQVNNNENKQ